MDGKYDWMHEGETESEKSEYRIRKIVEMNARCNRIANLESENKTLREKNAALEAALKSIHGEHRLHAAHEIAFDALSGGTSALDAMLREVVSLELEAMAIKAETEADEYENAGKVFGNDSEGVELREFAIQLRDRAAAIRRGEVE